MLRGIAQTSLRAVAGPNAHGPGCSGATSTRATPSWNQTPTIIKVHGQSRFRSRDMRDSCGGQ
eukprot:7512589-Prorocentrum_lima.AAC.1